MKEMARKISEIWCGSVVVLEDTKDAVPILAKALVEGGLPLCRGDIPHK